MAVVGLFLKRKRKNASASSCTDERWSLHLPCDLELSLCLRLMHPTCPILFSVSHWDHGIRVSVLTEEICRCIQCVFQFHHQDVVTCVALTENGHFLLTGSSDATVCIWQVTAILPHTVRLHPTPLHTLFGHDDTVTCVTGSSDFDLVCSCSADGTLILYNLRRGQYIRSIILTSPLSWCGIAPCTGQVVAYSATALEMTTGSFWINGAALGRKEVAEHF